MGGPSPQPRPLCPPAAPRPRPCASAQLVSDSIPRAGPPGGGWREGTSRRGSPSAATLTPQGLWSGTGLGTPRAVGHVRPPPHRCEHEGRGPVSSFSASELSSHPAEWNSENKVSFNECLRVCSEGGGGSRCSSGWGAGAPPPAQAHRQLPWPDTARPWLWVLALGPAHLLV